MSRPAEVVTRAELSVRLWGTDTFVDAAAGLNTAVAKLREALGDQAEQPIYIETVPKRGYRFIGAVTTSPSEMAQGCSPAIAGSNPRDTLHADFIVVGQVQTVDDRILVRSHLIRAADQAHVWVNEARMADSEAALQSTVSSRIAAAVVSKTQPAR